MPKPFVFASIALLAGFTLSPMLRAQTATPAQPGGPTRDKWNSDPFNGNGRNNPARNKGAKADPAPRRDLSGIWDATESGGVQAGGVVEHPASFPQGDPRPRSGQLNENGITHPIPYTALGEATLEAHKPSGTSIRSVPSYLANDPYDICDPVGFPYTEGFEFRTFQLAQTKNHVVFLTEMNHDWRVIWTDGRELPKNPKPRWNGYSVGHWTDDYTFVSETVGLNEKSWIDHAGRPHSKDLRVTEIFHRLDHDRMEHTLIINDPQMYTEPWMTQNKLVLYLQPADFDIRENFCVPSENAEYNKVLGVHTKDAPAVKENPNPENK